MRQSAVHSSPWAYGSLLVVLLPLVWAGVAQAQIADLRTQAEEAKFAQHTSHDAMVAYLGALQANSLDMRLGTYGVTREGRELIYAVFSRPLVTRPWEALVSGKPIVLLAANVHGGERTYRESLLLLVREMAERGTPANHMLDDLIIVVAPSLNPDGLEATPRPIRGNAWSVDMNRDYAKLGQPEIAQLIGNLVQQWRPHVWVDGHNGGAQPYNLTYQCGGHGGGDQRLTHICHQEMFPAIDRRLEAAGYLSWHYGSGNRERWTSATSLPRMGSDYAAMANIIGILFEAPGGQTLGTGTDAGVFGFKAVLEYTQQNSRKVMDLVSDARRETVRLGTNAEGQIVIRQTFVAEDYLVSYKIVEGTGADRRIVDVTDARLMTKPQATRLRDRPFAYILPRDAVAAVNLLRRHHVLVEVLQQDVEIEVQAYTLAGITYRSDGNHTATTHATVGDVVSVSRTFPRGSYVIPTGQEMGRIVTHLLEPETEDNVVVWNTMDAWLPKARLGGLGTAAVSGVGNATAGQQGQRAQQPALIPIFKVMQAIPLPTRVLEDQTR